MLSPLIREWCFVKKWSVLVCAGLAFLTPAVWGQTPKPLTVKPPIRGFVDMQTISWHNTNDSQPEFTLDNVNKFPGVFGGIVYNATWNEMQPAQGGPLDTKRLDRALDGVRSYNLAHPNNPLGVKLRIFQGNQAPLWAKKIGGRPVKILRNPMGCQSQDCHISIGRVWDSQYIRAWRAFLKKVAARYDAEPLIRSIAITSCTMETDEPFVMPVKQPVPKGYTDAADQDCLRGAVEDYVPWKRTVIDYTINVFTSLAPPGADPTFSISVMNECRHEIHRRCELGNHAFYSQMPEGNANIVCAISDKGGLIHYQTIGPYHVTDFDWAAMVRAARNTHATGVELWPDKDFGGFDNLTARQMRKLLTIFNQPAKPISCSSLIAPPASN